MIWSDYLHGLPPFGDSASPGAGGAVPSGGPLNLWAKLLTILFGLPRPFQEFSNNSWIGIWGSKITLGAQIS